MSPRRTPAEMAELKDAIVRLAYDNQPCTVRQLYYLGIGRYWEKDTGGSRTNYKNVVVRLVGDLREAGELPWGWIAYNTRYVRQAASYGSIDDALRQWQAHYRRDVWATQPRHVEVWCESDSIGGVIDDVTGPAGVGLFVCRGQASKTFVHEAVEHYRAIGKPVTILYVGDWDPSGFAIPLSLTDRMARYGGRPGDVDETTPSVELRRVALTPDDVASGDLFTHGANTKDSNYRRFAEQARLVGLDPQVAAEVEALPPDQLRRRLKRAIDDLVEDVDEWNATLAAEESERDLLQRMANRDTRSWDQ